MQNVKLLVAGSSTFTNKERLFKILDKNKSFIECVYSGVSETFDELVKEWCHENGITQIYLNVPTRDEAGLFDKGSVLRRNRKLIASANVILIFDGGSTGTEMFKEMALDSDKLVEILTFVPEPPKEKELKTKRKAAKAAKEAAKLESIDAKGEELIDKALKELKNQAFKEVQTLIAPEDYRDPITNPQKDEEVDESVL